MNPEEAQRSLWEIRTRRDQTYAEAGRAHLPWWQAICQAVLMFALGLVAEIDNLVYLGLCALALASLIIVTTRANRVRIHRSRFTGRTIRLMLITGASVPIAYLGGLAVAATLGFAYPSAAGGVVMAVVFLAETPWARREYGRSLR